MTRAAGGIHWRHWEVTSRPVLNAGIAYAISEPSTEPFISRHSYSLDTMCNTKLPSWGKKHGWSLYGHTWSSWLYARPIRQGDSGGWKEPPTHLGVPPWGRVATFSEWQWNVALTCTESRNVKGDSCLAVRYSEHELRRLSSPLCMPEIAWMEQVWSPVSFPDPQAWSTNRPGAPVA